MKVKYLSTLTISASILSLFLSGCSGDSTIETDENTSAIPTITGVVSDTTSSTLTVGNIEFNTTNTSYVSDGATDFGPGMVVTVEGTYSNNHGIAHKIKYDSEIEGIVISSDLTAIPGTEASDPMTYTGTMNVMGQSVIINSMTRFRHLDDPTMITQGNVVEISGMFEADGVILAKRIEYKADALDPNEEVEIKGYVNAYDEAAGTFMLGECIVTVTEATKLKNIDMLEDGMKVEVESIGEHVQIDPVCTIVALEIHNEDRDGFHHMAMIKGNVVGELVDNMFMLQPRDNHSMNAAGKAHPVKAPVKVMIHENTHFVNGSAEDILDAARIKVIGQYDENDILMARLVKFDNVDVTVVEQVKGIVISAPDMNGMFQMETRGGSTVNVIVNVDTMYLPVTATQDDIKVDTLLMATGMFDMDNNLLASLITIQEMGGTIPPPGIVPPMNIYDGAVESVVLETVAGLPSIGEISVLGQTISVTTDTKIFSSVPVPSVMPPVMPPEKVLTLADITPKDYVMIMAYYDDMDVLTARVIEVKMAPDMMSMGKVFGPITAADPMTNSLVVAGVNIIVTEMTEITPIDKFNLKIISDEIVAGRELKAMVKGSYDMTTGELTANHIAIRELRIIGM